MSEHKRKAYRQGDVLLIEVETLPDDENLEPKDNILAYGEITGHHHRFQADEFVHTWVNRQGQQYVTLFAPSILYHEEHESFEVAPGNYRVVIQQELDLTHASRYVVG